MRTTVYLAVAALSLGAATAQGQPAAAADAADIGNMQATMQQIRQTEDAERRAELLEQHLDEMHAVMGRMHRELSQLMHGMEEQRTERRRLHQHRPGPTRR